MSPDELKAHARRIVEEFVNHGPGRVMHPAESWRARRSSLTARPTWERKALKGAVFLPR